MLLLRRLIALLLALAAAAVLSLGGAVGLQLITWDVKGRVLLGGELAAFTAALAVVAAVGLTASVAAWKGNRWGALAGAGFWALGGATGLVTDRSVAGPGEPLATYLLWIGGLPGLITALALWAATPRQRHPEHERQRGAAP